MSAPTAVTAELLHQLPLPQASDDSDKDDRGRVLVIAGSPEVPGAALLAGVAALRAGAGKLQIATASSIAPHLGLAVPEALVVALPESPDGGVGPVAARLLVPRLARCDAVLIGPGMLDEEAVRDIAAVVLDGADASTFVLDAGALARLDEIVEPLRRQGGRVVITPHTGEMATLLGVPRPAVLADLLGSAREAASLLQAVVALKGATTYIVSPQGEAWFYDEGNVGLATSGSGDTLAGIIVGLLARGAKPLEAAVWGVYLHGEAGNRLSHIHGHVGFLARELLDAIPRIMADLQLKVSPERRRR
jgi:ADP-dependent NAD(P)H-hydrate dehydratase